MYITIKNLIFVEKKVNNLTHLPYVNVSKVDTSIYGTHVQHFIP